MKSIHGSQVIPMDKHDADPRYRARQPRSSGCPSFVGLPFNSLLCTFDSALFIGSRVEDVFPHSSVYMIISTENNFWSQPGAHRLGTSWPLPAPLPSLTSSKSGAQGRLNSRV